MKLLSILFFAGGVVFLILTVTQVLARGWGPLDVTVLDVLLCRPTPSLAVDLGRLAHRRVCFGFCTASLTGWRKSAPRKSAGLRRVQLAPGNWFALPVSGDFFNTHACFRQQSFCRAA